MDILEGRELEGMKAMLVIPSYGPIDPACAKDVRVNMMNAANHGLSWVGDASPDKMGWGSARNMATQSFLQMPEADGIMWIDSDMRLASTDISELLCSAKEYDADFVSGVYHQRLGFHNPVFYHFSKRLQKFQPFEEYPENVFVPVEGCGFGFVWTGRKTIEAITRHPDFDPAKGWFPDERDIGGFGEDLSFCYFAHRAGIQLHVNTSVQLGHVGEAKIIYRKDYLEKKPLCTPEERKKTAKKNIWGPGGLEA